MIDLQRMSNMVDEVIEARNEDFDRFEVRNPSQWTDEYIEAVKQNMLFMGVHFTYITDGSIEFED